MQTVRFHCVGQRFFNSRRGLCSLCDSRFLRPPALMPLLLAGLLAEALPAWEEMAVEAGAESFMRRNGCLYLQKTGSRFGRSWAHRMRSELGVRQELLSAEQVAAMEPTIPPFEGSGVFFPDSMNVTDPATLMEKLVAAGQAKGACFLRSRVTKLNIGERSIRLEGPDLAVTARNVVIAAGAFSRDLALQAGDKIPLETERGYHLEFATQSSAATTSGMSHPSRFLHDADGRQAAGRRHSGTWRDERRPQCFEVRASGSWCSAVFP